MRIAVVICIIFLSNIIIGQQLNQNLIGEVSDQLTEKPIADVEVKLLKNDSLIETVFTNEAGTYSFKEIPLGTYALIFQHPDYMPIKVSDITVLSGKENIINAEMSIRFKELEGVEVVANKDRSQTNNAFAISSAYTIDAVDARKVAGSLDDPIRFAGTLPGVVADAAFSENFISIRGNSPRALKYQMYGVELPNPTHFARIGSSGGTFTIFSMQLLGKSDFFTGAFPAEYGDALGGVFDVRFRKGNSTKREYAIHAGTLGLDFATEGPIGKNGASYLVNYRYAVVGLARLIGYPTQPTYQDFSFNVSLPTKKGGNISVFGIGGKSDRYRTAETDSSLWERDIDRFNLSLISNSVNVGVNYSQLIGEKTVLNFTTLLSDSYQEDNKEYLSDSGTFFKTQINQYKQTPISFAASIKHRFGTHHSNKTGGTFTTSSNNWFSEKHNFTTNTMDTLVNGNGNATKFRLFSESMITINEKLKINLGINYIVNGINNTSSLEPRAGINYDINPKNKLYFSYGRHSQIENYAVYYFQEIDSNGTTSTPNLNLPLAKADHLITGFSKKIKLNHLLKIEAYYQSLFDIPTSPDGTFSIVNLGELTDIRTLKSIGKGQNYGFDIGIERHSNQGLYYALNSSIFRSLYLDGQEVWRSTKYDYKYAFKFIAGKEYQIGEKKGKVNFVSWNTNFSLIGGQPYTPIDALASETHKETIYNESLAFEKRDKDLTFLDVTFTYKTNKKDRSSIWTLQLKNLFSNGAALYREYDQVTHSEVTVASSSFFPNLSYKLIF